MTDRDVLYRLLFYALIDLRTEGAEKKNGVVYGLADLFHQLPNQLTRLDRGEIDPSEVLADLRARAKDRRVSRWVEENLSTIQQNAPERAGQVAR